MRFPNSLPVDLAKELAGMTGVRLEPAWRELPHSPSVPRVRATLDRVQGLFCGPSPWRKPEVSTVSVSGVARSLADLALVSEPDCLAFPFAGHGHFVGCPTCAKRLAVIYAVAVQDLARADLQPKRVLYTSYRQALATLLPLVEIDCGEVIVPVLAETEDQERIALAAAERLWFVPEFVDRLGAALLEERARVGRELGEASFRKTAEGFVARTAGLRLVGSVTFMA